jgi:hypothetical protein
VLLSTGSGLIVTTTFCGVGQLLAVVVITYVTFTEAVVVLVSVSLIEATAPLEADSLMPAPAARVQLKVDPEVALVAVYVNVSPLQIAPGVNVLLSTGSGLIVTTTFCVVGQLLAVVVITYVTLIGAVVVLVSISLIEPVTPLEADSLMPATAARVQLKVDPEVALVAV